MRVLLIDDDRDEFGIVRHLLAGSAGTAWTLDWVGSYAEGLEALEGARYDVALVDYRIGVCDGLELIREAVGLGCPVPLILLTGQGGRELDLAAMEAGASDFLAKADLEARTLERSIRYAVRHKRAEGALRASEAEARKLALVAARTENAVIITDASGRIEWVNAGFTRITGYTPDEVLGRKPGEVLQGPETDPATVAFMSERLRAGEGFTAEVRNYRKGGRPYWLSIEVRPVSAGPGGPTHFIAIQSDVTERKRSEEALRESHREVARILGRITDGFFALDRDWRLAYINPQAELIFGRSADELLGRSLWEVFPEAVGTSFHRRYLRAMEESAPVAFEDLYEPLGIWLSVHIYPSADGLSVYFTDVTERRRSDEALRRSEAQYRLLAENSTDLITRHDPDGRILYASPACLAVIGRRPEELAGRPIFEEIHPEDRDRVRRSFESLLRSPGPGRVKFRWARGEGGWTWVETTSRAVVDPESGRVVEIQCATRDVGGSVRAEDEIRRLNEQLARRLRRLEALRQVDAAIVSGRPLRETLGVVVEQAVSQLGLDAAGVMLVGGDSGPLEVAASLGDRQPDPGPGSPGHRVARAGVPLHLPGRAPYAGPRSRGRRPGDRGFAAYHALPLRAQGRVRGVLEALLRAPHVPDPEWLDFLDTLADQAAIAIDNATLFDGLRATNARLSLAYESTIEGWARVLDFRDRETEGHSRRVTETTVRLARAMGLGEAELVHVRRGALLHDIGKMALPDAILFKPGPLTEAEWAVMKRHPDYAREMLWPIEFLRPALDIPYCHHERWDGSGYPRGLAGREIPLGARIFAAVDIWDALGHDRPYRRAWGPAEVRGHIRGLAGTHLDREVVATFLELTADPCPSPTPAEGVGPAPPPEPHFREAAPDRAGLPTARRARPTSPSTG